MKVRVIHDQEGDYYGIRFECPGCGDSHMVNTDWVPPGMARSKHAQPLQWHFNGDLDNPTLSPSLLVRAGHHAESDPAAAMAKGCYCNYAERNPDQPPMPKHWTCYLCHSFVTDGRIQFLGDCSHPLKDQTVALPDMPINSPGPDEE